MTNEELARAIQGGDKDKLLELWGAVRRFAHDRAYRWTMAVGGRAGLSVDDFEQGAFLALLEALEGWEDRGGSFLTWYGLKLRGAFLRPADSVQSGTSWTPFNQRSAWRRPLWTGRGIFCTWRT